MKLEEFKRSSDIALVVPSIREDCFKDFAHRWFLLGLWQEVNLILMEDNPERTFEITKDGCLLDTGPFRHIHFAWKDIQDNLGDKEWIIPRRSDTVRSFGYWAAWKAGYKFIMTLDDDCYPPTFENDGLQYEDAKSFIETHVGYLTKRTKWFSTLNDAKPRGLPFENLGTRNDILVNHGLWTNVLDYDAPTQLANPVKEKFSFDNRIVPHGSFFPFCGMNAMWRREATVLMYHMLMGSEWVDSAHFDTYEELQKFPFDRFGDIWCGIVMKKICDIMGYSVSTGMPYIRHERASNPFTNLKKEAAGIGVNEKFWEYIDGFEWNHMQHSRGLDILPMIYVDMGKHVEKFAGTGGYDEYFVRLGEAMQVWAGLFT